MGQTVRATTGADGQYWQALGEGRLDLPRCVGCGRWHWPAVWRCGDCGAWEHEWVETPLAGAVFTWTRTWHPFGGLEQIGVPFVTVVVMLEGRGGMRMAGILEGEESGVAIGRAVTGHIGETHFGGEAVPALRWRLSDTRPSIRTTGDGE